MRPPQPLLPLASSIVFSLLSVALKLISYPLHFLTNNNNNNNNNSTPTPTHLLFIRGEKLLSDLSTWGIGGPCNHFVQVFDHHQLAAAIRYCNEQSIRYVVVGKGSNCLFDDLGFDGCVILNSIVFLEKIEPGCYRAGSGYPVNRLGVQSVSEGFTGLEFAAGIPGTVGGALYMNAGANGQETAGAVESIEIITTKGEYKTIKRRDLSFSYRSSPFQDMNDLAAITAVTFRLKVSQSAKIKQQEYLKRLTIASISISVVYGECL
ncbi:UDP-n-acetylenolpyruvoylglucosamine reductase [Phtheirospermum japonicum]|uniref:UDP-n-acetylenolpyruvoylglucosamine reductase n=1 Tax=Phtheirospermum japonicum TaxID=374723 RepID=A0A830BN65_9LAMI|nr:UDP-n-acetylenolpyruvoylglucosamine reductase [Phtheirospermum japonicum]